jgi:hypothetical protein
MEPWLTYIIPVSYTEQSHPIVASNQLVADCQRRGVKAQRLFGKQEMIYEA